MIRTMDHGRLTTDKALSSSVLNLNQNQQSQIINRQKWNTEDSADQGYRSAHYHSVMGHIRDQISDDVAEALMIKAYEGRHQLL